MLNTGNPLKQIIMLKYKNLNSRERVRTTGERVRDMRS
jgi:hypothetical protein